MDFMKVSQMGLRHWLLCRLALSIAAYYGMAPKIWTRGRLVARTHVLGARLLERPFKTVSAAIDKIRSTA